MRKPQIWNLLLKQQGNGEYQVSKIITLTTDNRIVVNNYPSNNLQDTLATLQEAVKGYVEFVQFPRINLLMVVNEEGKINNLPINQVATSFFYRELGVTDYIVGDVAFLSNDTDTVGDPIGLNYQQVKDLVDDISWRLDEAKQATEDISNDYATLKGE